LKKAIFLLAATSAAFSAAAQSTVHIWGVVDTDVGHYSIKGNSNTIVSSSGNLPSQLGFRGTEDLGGGLAAHFWLEAGLLSDNGQGAGDNGGFMFNRRSTVGISGGLGELRLGREIAPTFWNNIVFDPFGSLGPGAVSNLTLGASGNGLASANPVVAALPANAITYLYGHAPNGQAYVGRGFYAQVMHTLAENVGAAPAIGRSTSARVGFAKGSANVALSYGESIGPGAYGAVPSLNYKDLNLGASYDTSIATLMGHVGTTETAVAGTKYTHWHLGAFFKVGVGNIPVSYGSTERNDTVKTGASQVAIGYLYNLSKRTALYTNLSHITNRNGGTFTFRGGNGSGNPGLVGGGSGTGYDVGVRTTF
jgi:predicted porin